MTNIYILQLTSNKYYIGKTENVASRVQEHFKGTGSAWTKLYHPVRLVISYPNCDNFDEDKYTKKYMSKYGIDNVRGGSYCKLTLTDSEKDNINRELSGASGECLKCGKMGHFAAQCHVKASYYSQTHNPVIPTTQNKITSGNKCYRCGRSGHYADSCYAKTNNMGMSISVANTFTRSRKDGDSNMLLRTLHIGSQLRTGKRAYSSSKINKWHPQYIEVETKQSNGHCYRCGRTGHYANKCYAKTTQQGMCISDSDDDY